MARGVARQDIFLDDEDRTLFLHILRSVVKKHGWLLYAYCLMDNHYHLLVETPRANISKGMHLLNTRYCVRFNRRHDRVGHVLQGRFKSFLVDRHGYLLELSRYIVLNPVKTGFVKRPEDWRWSSYRATIGLERVPDFLWADYILGMFSSNRMEARKRYREFVMEGLSQIASEESEKVLEDEKHYTAAITKELEEIWKSLKPVEEKKREPVKALRVEKFLREMRDYLILKAVYVYGLSTSEAAKFLGVHQTTIYRVLNKYRDGKNRWIFKP